MTIVTTNPDRKDLIHPKSGNLNPIEFFIDLFPNVYICATSDTGAQFNGVIPCEDLPIQESEINTHLNSILTNFQQLNKAKHNIFFTPNGVRTVEGKNKLDNFCNINAWWIDIDVEETKKGDDEETAIYRNHKKGDILGKIFDMDNEKWPSITVETRNGYQLYWLADSSATQENWGTIGNALYEEFKKVGADKSTVKVVQLMRLPNFYYFKRGIQGKIRIVWPFSSFQRFSEIQMMNMFPTQLSPLKSSEIDLDFLDITYKPNYPKDIIHSHDNDIFQKVIEMPIDEVIMKLSSTWLVNGDKILIERFNTDKSNLFVGGKLSPNFIARGKNHIYSNNAEKKGPTIIQYLEWYKWTKAEIAKGLKEIFKF